MEIPGVAVPVSRVVMGTDWLAARRFKYIRGRRLMSPFVNRQQERKNFELLDGVVAAGCTAFDTARAYPDSERSLGAWLRARQLRERVAVISKGAHPGPSWQSRLSPSEISRDLEQSLKTLQTDYIDVYLLHYDDGVADVRPLVDCLNEHLAGGRIRAFGVSNWPTSRIISANTHARTAAKRSIAFSSVQFSLASWRNPPWPNALSLSGRESEQERQWYRDNDLWLLAYSSLAMGFFSRARPYADDPSAASAPVTFGDRVFLHADNLARLQRAREMAERVGASPGRVALAWVLRFSPRVLPIVGARTAAAYIDAAQACELPLTETERRWLSHGS